MRNSGFLLGIEGPCLRNLETGTPNRVYQGGPARCGLVGIYEDEHATRRYDPVSFLEALEQRALVIILGGCSCPTLSVGCGYTFLFLGRKFSCEVLWIQKTDACTQPHVTDIRQL